MKFTITIRATSITIKPGKEAIDKVTPLINTHTFEDEYQEITRVMGFMYDEQNDVLYFHKGIDINYLRRLLGECVVKEDPFHPYKEMKYDFEEIIPPRDAMQVDAIDFLAGQGKYQSSFNDSQLFLVLVGGSGKSFCTGYAVGLFGAKTLIIMHRDNLRSQWYNSLLKMNGYPESRIHEVSTTEEFESICRGTIKLDYDVYLMTHATFRSGLKRIEDMSVASNFTKNLGIGVKVIDEAHLEFKDTLLMDFIFNVKRNIYLTATDGRSQRNENSIFKHVFANATFYRKDSKKAGHPDKWVEYVTVHVNTHVKPNVYRYRVNGGRGMSPVTYGKWVIQKDKQQTHFKVCKELIREIYENEPTAKVIVFMPLIDLCTECAYFINDLNYDDTFKYDISVKTINSHNAKSENEINKRADVIVTTTQSLGVGVDIKGITDIICCSPFVSKILAKQVMWRIRYIEKKCHYYDVIDVSVPADIYWWKSRSKVFKQMCTKFISLTWNEGGEDSDTKEAD